MDIKEGLQIVRVVLIFKTEGRCAPMLFTVKNVSLKNFDWWKNGNA